MPIEQARLCELEAFEPRSQLAREEQLEAAPREIVDVDREPAQPWKRTRCEQRAQTPATKAHDVGRDIELLHARQLRRCGQRDDRGVVELGVAEIERGDAGELAAGSDRTGTGGAHLTATRREHADRSRARIGDESLDRCHAALVTQLDEPVRIDLACEVSLHDASLPRNDSPQAQTVCACLALLAT